MFGPVLSTLRTRSLRALLVVTGMALFALAVRAHAQPPRVPILHFESTPELRPQTEELADLDPASLLPIVALVGLDDPGPPIRVMLVPEGSPKARLMPSWGVAYAIGNAGTVVMVPSRVPTYPNDSLEAVLRHEVAHVLIARAAGYRSVPRWFNEGLATIAGRKWSLEDRGLVMLAAIPRSGLTMHEVDQGFYGGTLGAQRAYALSAAFVRWLLEQDGPDAAARILERIADGEDFHDAFRNGTGRSLTAAERAYWRQLNLWSRWIPILGSSSFLWIVITALAVYAFRRRKARDEELRRQWQEEEEMRKLIEARQRLGPRHDLADGELPSNDTWVN